jgi:hypothetical protein
VQVPHLRVNGLGLEVLDAAQQLVWQPSDAQLQQHAQQWQQAAALLATAPNLVLGNPARSTFTVWVAPWQKHVAEAALMAMQPLATFLPGRLHLDGVPLTPGTVAAMGGALRNVVTLGMDYWLDVQQVWPLPCSCPTCCPAQPCRPPADRRTLPKQFGSSCCQRCPT